MTIEELQEVADTTFTTWVRICRRVFSKYAIKDPHSDSLIKKYRTTIAAIRIQVAALDGVCGAARDEVLENIEYLQNDGVTRLLDLVCYLGDGFHSLGIDDDRPQELVTELDAALYALGDAVKAVHPDCPVPNVPAIKRVRDLRQQVPKEHVGEWK